MSRFKITLIILVVILVAAATWVVVAAAQTAQRFEDVPPDHPAHTAIEWAAEVGLTTGYGDGTFRPEQPMAKWRALVFMERYYDQVLEAAESDSFTSGNMMVLLKAINDGGDADVMQPTTTTTTAAPVVTTTTEPPTTVPSGSLTIIDSYWSADGETYYVKLGGVENFTYCEVHMILNGRRTGDWNNDLWSGTRSAVTIEVRYIEHPFDALEVECS